MTMSSSGSSNLVDADFRVRHPLPDPAEAADKNERGTVLLVAGSAQTPGAALLAAMAALRVGAGKVQIATVRSAASQLAIAMPEARVIALNETADGEISPGEAARLEPFVRKAHAIVIGPGMIDEAGAAQLALALFGQSEDARFLVDAAALTGLRERSAALRDLEGRLVVTPHAGEMAAFCGVSKDEVDADPERAGCRAADRLQGVVMMKGGQTYICEPGDRSMLCEGGGLGLAIAGSGDVLAGAVGGLLARGASPPLAAQWGAYLHAEAGRRLGKRIGSIGFLARELPGILPELL